MLNLWSVLFDVLTCTQYFVTIKTIIHDTNYEFITTEILYTALIPVCLYGLFRLSSWYYGFLHFGEIMNKTTWDAMVRVPLLYESCVLLGFLSPYLFHRFFLSNSEMPFSKDLCDVGQFLAIIGFSLFPLSIMNIYGALTRWYTPPTIAEVEHIINV